MRSIKQQKELLVYKLKERNKMYQILFYDKNDEPITITDEQYQKIISIDLINKYKMIEINSELYSTSSIRKIIKKPSALVKEVMIGIK